MVSYRRLAVLLAFGPHLRDGRLHRLQGLLEGLLQLLGLPLQLEERQRLQQAVDLLCRAAREHRDNVTALHQLVQSSVHKILPLKKPLKSGLETKTDLRYCNTRGRRSQRRCAEMQRAQFTFHP